MRIHGWSMESIIKAVTFPLLVTWTHIDAVHQRSFKKDGRGAGLGKEVTKVKPQLRAKEECEEAGQSKDREHRKKEDLEEVAEMLLQIGDLLEEIQYSKKIGNAEWIKTDKGYDPVMNAKVS